MPFASLNTSVMNCVLLYGVSPFVVASHGASDWSPEPPAAFALIDELLSVRHASMFRLASERRNERRTRVNRCAFPPDPSSLGAVALH